MVGAGLPSLRVAFGARDPKVGGSGVEDDREVLQRGAKLWRREEGKVGTKRRRKIMKKRRETIWGEKDSIIECTIG